MNRLFTIALLLTATVFGLTACGGAPTSNSVLNSPSNSANNAAPGNTAANVPATDVNSSTPPTSYTVGVEQQFVKACEDSGGSRQLCVCVYGKVKERYSFAEFTKLESQVLAGEPPADFVTFSAQAREECSK